MKKVIIIFLLLKCFITHAQLEYGQFYSKKSLENNFKNAKTPSEKILALGNLAHYGFPRDSIAKEIDSIARKQNDKNLLATSLWWDALLHPNDTTKAIKLLQFGVHEKLLLYQIAANLLRADYHIHNNLDLTLYYTNNADSLLNRSGDEKLNKDSLRIEVLHRFGHLFIHKGESLQTARHLVQLRRYLEREKMDALKIQALETLNRMYLEWEDTAQVRKCIPWTMTLYHHFKKTGEWNKVLVMTFSLGVLYAKLEVRDSAARYFKEQDRLADSLEAYGQFLYWSFGGRFLYKIFTLNEAIDLLDNNFNGHWFFSATDVVKYKATTYVKYNQEDSALVYLSKLKKQDPDTYGYLAGEFYLNNKDYKNALAPLKEFEKKATGTDLQKAFKDISDVYENLGNYKLAFEYLAQYNKLKDSLDNVRSEAEINSLEMQKEIEIQAASYNEQQKLEKAEKDRIIFENKIRFFSLLAGVFILLLIASLLWRNNRRKQRDKIKIEQAYSELKSTQQQLIQSEKMASLGELTAGIAHEIQNPLNFVNNFSDVNTELVDEAKQEMDKGNVEEVKVILNDIKDNEQKINHHGKRADAIVKGMLQHSRTSSGQKEPTDINALADEYLRLAYHGMRAKDKSFNATTKTEFDNSIGKINVVPQEIGRVILNLINNAFYAVDEKKRLNGDGYEPGVTISTTKSHGKVKIKVADNGNGIPPKVLDKIFQPFFTTKPTGQGTGLGLSLAYDIAKAHGGELTVDSKEGEYTEFTLGLSSKD